MAKRKYEVHADNGPDHFIVGADDREAAELIAADFKKDGYTNVRIVENV